jgi:hypothetical protein
MLGGRSGTGFQTRGTKDRLRAGASKTPASPAQEKRMTNGPASAIAKKQLEQREALWPGAEPNLWNRKANKGFATIPKTMPLILQIMDEMSKGKPLSSTYLGLWCETWDNSMVNVGKHREMAHSAGFSGQRAEYTWSGRIEILRQLNFIDVKPGKSGPISHVLIWNPHYVIRWHHQHKTPGLVEASYNALLDRALEIGAKDMVAQFTAPGGCWSHERRRKQ